MLAAMMTMMMSFAAVPSAWAQGPNYSGDCRASSSPADCGVVAYIQLAINILSAMVGIVVVIMIAVGGVQYVTAQDNPQAVEAARERIRNALIALVAYIFSYAFLQYLIPGGLF